MARCKDAVTHCEVANSVVVVVLVVVEDACDGAGSRRVYGSVVEVFWWLRFCVDRPAELGRWKSVYDALRRTVVADVKRYSVRCGFCEISFLVVGR